MNRFAFIIISIIILFSTILFAQTDFQKTANEIEFLLIKAKQDNNKPEIAKYQVKIGYLYWENDQKQQALDFFQQAIKTNEDIGNQNAIKTLCTNIGMIYSDLNDFEQALMYFKKSLRINHKSNRRIDIASDQFNISNTLQAMKKYDESNKALEEALTIFQENGDVKSVKNCYTVFYENYEKLGNNQKAKEYFELSASIGKQLQKEELKQFESRTKQVEASLEQKEKLIQSTKDTILKMSSEMRLQIELRDKERELSLYREKAQKDELNKLAERAQSRNRLIVSMGAVLLLVVGFFIFIVWQLRERKKAYKLLELSNKQIVEQKEEIEKQRDIAETQKRKVTDSINYAKRIQSAVMPPLSLFEKYFPEHFILFNPRDIVSGDFYWITQKDGVIIVAVADCTGHGVPGAFMSMLGVAYLNEIVNKIAVNRHIRTLHANEILNQLRDNVIASLHQTGKSNESKDGMDISLCIVDLEQKHLQYAGAHNPLYIIRNNELIHIEADRMPIGYYRDITTPFINHEITIENGDMVYMFTDGYYDQLGGPKNQKYFSANFRKLLLEIHQLPLPVQREKLQQSSYEWRGSMEQIDDQLVIGFKIKPTKISTAITDEYSWPDKRVLIAEDMDLNYFLLSEALKPTKVQVFRVMNGADAVDFCKAHEIDLVLMDIRMPVMDGIEATQNIRQFNRNLPIVAQTAQSDPEDKEKIFAVGCNDYIAKPVNLKTFLMILKKYLS